MHNHKSVSGAKQAAQRRLATVSQLADLLGGALSQPAIRSQIWAADDRTLKDGRTIKANGLKSAIIKIGRKTLIDVDVYLDWLESHRLAPLADLDALKQAA